MRALALAMLALAAIATSAHAATPIELDAVEAAPVPNATLPLDIELSGERGDTRPLRQWLGLTPSIWVLADYTCETLCGPVISIVAGALARSQLQPARDFRLIVVGIDAKDTDADAQTMKRAQIGEGALASQSYFLRADRASLGRLMQSMGYRVVYDREHDQYAHPAAAFVVDAGGRIVRTLSGLAVEPNTLRMAIVDAGRGKIGTVADHIRLLCYGYDPARGVYSVAIGRIMSGLGALTIAFLAGLIVFLLRSERAARSA